jgi:hypothetical protein
MQSILFFLAQRGLIQCVARSSPALHQESTLIRHACLLLTNTIFNATYSPEPLFSSRPYGPDPRFGAGPRTGNKQMPVLQVRPARSNPVPVASSSGGDGVYTIRCFNESCGTSVMSNPFAEWIKLAEVLAVVVAGSVEDERFSPI